MPEHFSLACPSRTGWVDGFAVPALVVELVPRNGEPSHQGKSIGRLNSKNKTADIHKCPHFGKWREKFPALNYQ